MTALRHRLALEVIVVSPFLTIGNAMPQAGIDTAINRDAHDRLAWSGSLVRGVTRGTLQHLVDRFGANHVIQLGSTARPLAADLKAWFGNASGAASGEQAGQDGWRFDNEPDRGALEFGDLTLVPGTYRQPDAADRRYFRVAIEPALGAAKEAFLQVIELPYAIGEEVAFRGFVDVRGNGEDIARVKALLERLWGLVPAIGANKSAGFGRIATVTISDVGGVTMHSVSSNASSLRLTYEVDRPFVIGTDRIGSNHFEGSSVLPGAAIKGTLASNLHAAGVMTPALEDLLARTMIGHAAPGAAPSTPFPLSLAVDGDALVDQLYATDPTPRLDNERTAALRFLSDWKKRDFDRVRLLRKEQEIDLRRVMRTRTSIVGDLGIAAKSQLFSETAVVPEGQTWTGRIVPPDGADAADLALVLGALAQGVSGFGKTGAILTGKAEAESDPPSADRLSDGRWAVVLETPALLNDLDRLEEAAASDEDLGVALQADYAAYFARYGFELVRFFAQQHLVGGYLALRYPPRHDRYQPYLLTKPGSVFLLQEAVATATSNATDFALRGLLPRPENIAEPAWQHCPFLRENGFGRVHFQSAAEAQRFRAPVSLPELP